MAQMTAWSFDMNSYAQCASYNKVLEALEVQDEIGWTPFLEGCIAKEWMDIQEQHYCWM
jgi:hypothetical protein